MSLNKITDSIAQQSVIAELIKAPELALMSPTMIAEYLESESYCITYPDTTHNLTELISRALSAVDVESIA